MNLFDTSEQSPVTTPAPERERPGGRTVLLVVLGLGLLLGGGWTAAYLAAGDKVPRGTTVAGVAVGGKEPAAAATTLEQGLADQVAAPISVRVGDQTREITPAEAGLSVDYAASVADAGGRTSWSPARLWTYFTGGDDLDAVVSVDDDAMAATLAAIEEDAGTPAEDGAVAFRGGKPRVTDPVVGSRSRRQRRRRGRWRRRSSPTRRSTSPWSTSSPRSTPTTSPRCAPTSSTPRCPAPSRCSSASPRSGCGPSSTPPR